MSVNAAAMPKEEVDQRLWFSVLAVSSVLAISGVISDGFLGSCSLVYWLRLFDNFDANGERTSVMALMLR